MKKGDKKRQAKALAKRTKRKQAQKRAQHEANSIATRLIRRARSYPIEGCWTQPDWEVNGMAVVVVARRQPNELLTFGSFVVDYYCLGVKDCFIRPDMPASQFYKEVLPQLIPGGQPFEISSELAHELVWGSVDYATQFDFHPHRDFTLSQYVLDPPDQHPRSGTVTFGKDGEPFYITGPHDNVNAILDQLLRTAGPDNFHFLVPI